MQVHLIPALGDNYVYMLTKGDKTAIVDPGDAAPVIDRLEAEGRELDLILNTHHHGDHIAGNAALKRKYGARLIGPRSEAARIDGMDEMVAEGDRVDFAGSIADVFETPGHTKGHIAFHFAAEGVLFCGDTLFSLGCGRLFEGSPAQMWDSLQKLRALPDDTKIYCGHEYTQTNARFCTGIDPDNQALSDRAADIARLRAADKPTIPALLGDEKAANPFLRADKGELQAAMNMTGADPVEVFAKIRALRDSH